MLTVLNAQLYLRLEKEFGDVQVINCGSPAEFALFKGEGMGFRFGRVKNGGSSLLYPEIGLTGMRVENSHWGEIYQVCCPCCGDSRFRLNVCHLYGSQVQEPKSKDSKSVRMLDFGRPVVCFNEGCQKDKTRFWEMFHRRIFPQGPITATSFEDLAGTVSEGVSSPFSGKLGAMSTRVRPAWQLSHMSCLMMPKKCLPISAQGVPDADIRYLVDRGFDPDYLYRDYGVLWAPKGAEYQVVREGIEATDDDWRRMDENRMIIPIVQGGMLVSWQGRILRDQEKGDPCPKYRNPPGIPKTSLVYGADRAKFFDDVVITEGVTNIWAMGESHGFAGVAVFGKTLSGVQVDRLRDLWGFGGRAVLNLDPDVDDRKRRAYIRELREKQVFPRGIADLVLPPGMDAAKMFSPGVGRGQEYVDLVREALDRATNDQEPETASPLFW